MCCKCEAVDDFSVGCEQCGKRTHVFWQDPVGDFIDYLLQSRPFADKVYVISHNSRGYDAQFLLIRFLELRWMPKLIMDGSKILSMVVETTLSEFAQLFTNESKELAEIIRPHMQEGILSPHLQHSQQFGLCGPLS